MDFFNSLTLDLKLMVVGIAGCALLALFSSNPNAEKRYVLVLAVLAAVGVYRFHRTVGAEAETSAAASSSQQVVTAPAKHVPLVSTSGK